MITLTKIDGTSIAVNADEIETAETSVDTALTLKSGRKLVVRESREEIVEKVVEYKRRCMKGALSGADFGDSER